MSLPPRTPDLVKLIRVLRECTSTLVPETLYGIIVHAIHRELGPYYLVSLFRVDRVAGRLSTVANAGDSIKEFEAKHRGGYSQGLDVGVTGHVARSGKTYLVRDVAHDPLHHLPDWTDPQSRSELCVPVAAGADAAPIALINIEAREANAFSEEQVALLELLAEHLGQCLKNAQLHATLLAGTQRYREAAGRVRREHLRLAALLGLFPAPPLLLNADGHLAAVAELRAGSVRLRPPVPAAGSGAPAAPPDPATASAWQEARARLGAAAAVPYTLHRKGGDGADRPVPGRLVAGEPGAAAAADEILFLPDAPLHG